MQDCNISPLLGRISPELNKPPPVINIKGHEMNLCQIAKPRDYQKLLQMNVCFDIQQALKLTLMYRKYNSFMYLLSNIKFKEQLNYLYHHRNNSTTTLMAIATI